MLTTGRRAAGWLTALLLVLGVATAPLWAGAQARAADPPVGPCVNTYVCVGASAPASPGSTQGGGGNGGGGGSQTCQWKGQTVPCTTDFGTFDSADGCYYAPAQPQPPAGDLAWQGHQPGDGMIYVQTCPLTGGGGRADVWMAAGPAAPVMTPGALALVAANKIPLGNTTVRTAPNTAGSNGAATTALVGAPVWLWVDQGLDRTTGKYLFEDAAHKQSATASVPGLSVTAQAWVKSVTWDMGDGLGIAPICTPPGTAYQPSDGGAASPDCSYVYAKPSIGQPGQQYVISATVTWTVTWSASTGATGAFDMPALPAHTEALGVSEVQVLN
ncbi:hypothetical protein [Streptacidiphilus sp. EB129]|uniref:hypothetical protein n=1 Tax=Streptacidiphilus sp. EB129 TaxID=3156262 RepID=UPI003517FADF